MKTQILLTYRPVNSRIAPPYTSRINVNEKMTYAASKENDFAFRLFDNDNKQVDTSYLVNVNQSAKLVSLDLYEDTEIPLNFRVADIREPDKVLTNFSKTIILPGTKNNHRIFNHVYLINGSSKFNPALKTEVVILQEGVQVMRGNLQVKNIIHNNDTSYDYEVIITGDFTSLFTDIGNAKLSDLDLSEYEHEWSMQNLQKSWDGELIKDGQTVSNVDVGPTISFTSIGRQEETDRVQINTLTEHNVVVGDFVRITTTPDSSSLQQEQRHYIEGDFQVAEVIDDDSFTINFPFPPGLLGNSLGGNIKKFNPTGEGYVYPKISWGDDSIQVINGNEVPRFTVQAFPMAFYVKAIWDKIFEKTNSKYQSNFINSKFFKRLLITQKRTNYDLPIENMTARSFKVANQIPYEVLITGFGPNDTGSVPYGDRGFPVDVPFHNNVYPFPSDIEGSAGVLYNGVEGSRPFDQTTNKWKVTDSGKYSMSFNISLQIEAVCSDYRTTGANIPPVNPGNSPQGVGLFFEPSLVGGVQVNIPYQVVAAVRLIYKPAGGGNARTIGMKKINLCRNEEGELYNAQRPNFKTFLFPVQDFVIGFEEQFLKKDDEIHINVNYYHNINNNLFGVFSLVSYVPPTYYPDGEINQPGYWVRNPYRGTVKLKDIGVQYMVNKPVNQLTEGSIVQPQLFLPKDMTCQEFLLNIIKAFNLHIESDKDIEKFYRIEPRADYYKDGSGGSSDYVDWSEKVDLEKIDIMPIGEITAKFYNFKYKEESDYWNKKYRDDVGVSYGDYNKEIQNDFLKNSKDVNITFGSTVMINSPRDTDIVIPQVVQRDNNGINKVTNSATKFLFWGGMKPVSRLVNRYWRLESVVPSTSGNPRPGNPLPTILDLRKYPYAGTVDSPLDPIYDLNWYYTEYVYWDRARWSNENLYNKYWKGFIDEITDIDSKVIRARLNLSPKDINNLDFKKIYIINGTYLRLQKIIDYSANGYTLTECEFLKLKSPSRFKRMSRLVSNAFSRTVDNSRLITTSRSELAPMNFTDRNPVSNWTASDISGSPSVTLNGQNNVLASAVNNVSISGDENYIGAGSTNININGNGVFISGGLKNVNVIGTDKLFIDESNVTYINGIRYKNGVAISRASVIDGGMDKVSNRASLNTTANVVDACEDVVINDGSVTVEDVVNAGENRILPDVPDYGISTSNSPNPVTNYSGVSNNLTPSDSVESLIKAKVNPSGYRAGGNKITP